MTWWLSFMTVTTSEVTASLLALFEEAAAFHLRLRAVARDLHRWPGLTVACRGVLQDLMGEGHGPCPSWRDGGRARDNTCRPWSTGCGPTAWPSWWTIPTTAAPTWSG
jgi:hypothetical protein